MLADEYSGPEIRIIAPWTIEKKGLKTRTIEKSTFTGFLAGLKKKVT